MRCIIAILIVLPMFASSLRASLSSIGELGIRSQGLGLDGGGILIGYVELGRPGKPDKDDPIYVHEQTVPTQVYAGTMVDSANSIFVQGDNGRHATAVAGVMIARPVPLGSVVGVAPAANLHAGAHTATDDASIALATNRIAPSKRFVCHEL
jgi:hypothetical protein